MNTDRIEKQIASLPAKSLQFPQLAEGGGWATGVGVQNMSNESILISLTAYQSDGTLFAAPTVGANPVTRQLNAGGVFRSSLKDLLQVAAGPLITGWLKVETNTSAIIGPGHCVHHFLQPRAPDTVRVLGRAPGDVIDHLQRAGCPFSRQPAEQYRRIYLSEHGISRRTK